MSRISMRNLFTEEERSLVLLVFFSIAEQVAGEVHNMMVNPRLAVCMPSRTDSEDYANANYSQLKINKRSQNFSLQQLFIEVYKSSDCTL